MEDGEITISRASGTLTAPAEFILVGAMNPCKCGWYGHPSGRCSCALPSVELYRSRVSGPLMDRVDLRVSVPATEYTDLVSSEPGETSSVIRHRVEAARERQRARLGVTACNGRMTGPQTREHCPLDAAGQALMEQAFARLGLTGRSYDRLLRISRTIADLAGVGQIGVSHLSEALQFRG